MYLMATETGLGDQPFSPLSPHHQSPTRNIGAAIKRKRESVDHDSPSSRRHHSSRGDSGLGSSSNSAARRAASNHHQYIDAAPNLHDGSGTEGYMQAQHNGGSGAPPHSSTETHADHHFDLSALQHSNASSNSQQGAHGAVTDASMDTAAAALNHYTMSVPPHPAEAFLRSPTAGADKFVPHDPFRLDTDSRSDGSHLASSNNPASNKPPVGSDEWHRQRKDSHKEVERRRRETINEGINELAKIVPGVEKNKGTILQRAVQYIKSLHDDVATNIDRWTFEKLVTEQAIAELSNKIQRAYDEREAWKRIAREAGVDVDNVDLGLPTPQDGQSPQPQQQQSSHTDMNTSQGNRAEVDEESEEDGDDVREAELKVSAALTAELAADNAHPADVDDDDDVAAAHGHLGNLSTPMMAEDGTDMVDEGVGEDEHPVPTTPPSPTSAIIASRATGSGAGGSSSRVFKVERSSGRRGRSARS